MLHINILTPFPHSEFTRQMPTVGLENVKFYENGPLDVIYDVVVIYEGITEYKKIKSIKGNIIYICGEPEMSRVYTKSFLNQFDYVVTSHKKKGKSKHLTNQQSLPWHFGLNYRTKHYQYDFQSLVNLECPKKTKIISAISSGKNMMPGHKQRKVFIDKLKLLFSEQIDFFGKDSNFVADKAEAILPYYFTICIENSETKNYWTEKIADAFLGYSIPIYVGCTNLDDFFPKESYIKIDISNEFETEEKIKDIIQNYEEIYSLKQNELIKARDLILYKYNIYFTILDLIETENLEENKKFIRKIIKPNEQFFTYKFEFFLLKLKRKINKR